MAYNAVFNWWYILRSTIIFTKFWGSYKWPGKFGFEINELLKKSVSYLALQQDTIFSFVNMLFYNQTFSAFDSCLK